MRVVRAVIVLAALSAAAPVAACEAEGACRTARLRSAATYFSALVRCRLREPFAVAQSCRDAAFAALERSLGRADASKSCSVADEAGAITFLIDNTQVNDLRLLIGLDDRDFRCQRARWMGVARFARNLLLAHARHATRPDAARLDATTARLEGELARALARATGFGDCRSASGTVEVLSVAIRKMVEHVCPVCGNAVRGGAEQCDVGDGPCAETCAADCTCPAAGFCGNNRVDLGEECDGTDAAACATTSGFAQCGGPGRTGECTCGVQPVSEGMCASVPPSCPAGQSCAGLAIFAPEPRLVHACIAPEPATCTDGDGCALFADSCRAGECCAPLGGICGPQNPCCEGATCGFFGNGSPSVCCRNPAEPCERDADCCQGLCELGPTGGQCAFF